MARKHEQEAVTRRSYAFEMRADEGEQGKVIEGIPIVFDQPTHIRDLWTGEDYTEMITRKALDNADLSDVCLFVNHEMDKIPLARSRRGKGTLSLDVTDEGVKMRAVLDTEHNPEASALYSAVSRGDIAGMSFCFRVRGDHWQDLETDHPLRIIDDISIIHEVSAVTDPAYPQTSISARSSEETESPLAEARARLTASKESDAEALMLEKAKLKVKSWI